MYQPPACGILYGMKLAAIVLGIALAVIAPSAADAARYSGNRADNLRVSAHVRPDRACHKLATRYELVLVNRMPRSRWFEVSTAVGRLKMSDFAYRVPGRSRVVVAMGVLSGRHLDVGARFHGKALVHRRLAGICHY